MATMADAPMTPDPAPDAPSGPLLPPPPPVPPAAEGLASDGGPRPFSPAPTTARRFGRGILSLIVGVAISLSFLSIFLREPRRADRDIRAAELFMDCLRYGGSALQDGKTSGYGAAFEMLVTAKQDALGFDGFVAFFDDLVARNGLIQAAKRTNKETGRAGRRRLFFELVLSGEGGDEVRIPLEIVMTLDGADYKVADFAVGAAGQARR